MDSTEERSENPELAAMIRDRRTFLRQTASLGGVSVIGGLAGCLDGGSVIDPTETGGDGEPAAATPDLRQGTEIGIGFTGFGGLAVPSEVDPDEPGGGRGVTVDAVEPGEAVTISWRQTVERETSEDESTPVGIGDETPTPEGKLVEETGTITATGLAAAHTTFLPMFWEPGETTTNTSAIWLSREAYRELEGTRRTAWTADVLTRITWVGREVQERIHDAVETVDEVVLEAEGDYVAFELTTDGEPTTVQAVKAHDSFGNEYVIVANEANPLVVEFTYDAVSVGITGFDTALWSLIKAVFSGYQVVSLDVPMA